MKPAKAPSFRETLMDAESELLREFPAGKPEVRAAAALLDLAFLFIAMNALDVLCNALHAWYDLSTESRWLLRTALFVGFWVWPLARFRYTPGKKLFGLRVINAADGSPLPFHRALLRETLFKAVTVLSGVGLYWFFRTPKAPAIHDRLAHSASKRVHGAR